MAYLLFLKSDESAILHFLVHSEISLKIQWKRPKRNMAVKSLFIIGSNMIEKEFTEEFIGKIFQRKVFSWDCFFLLQLHSLF